MKDLIAVLFVGLLSGILMSYLPEHGNYFIGLAQGAITMVILNP